MGFFKIRDDQHLGFGKHLTSQLVVNQSHHKGEIPTNSGLFPKEDVGQLDAHRSGDIIFQPPSVLVQKVGRGHEGIEKFFLSFVVRKRNDFVHELVEITAHVRNGSFAFDGKNLLFQILEGRIRNPISSLGIDFGIQRIDGLVQGLGREKFLCDFPNVQTGRQHRIKHEMRSHGDIEKKCPFLVGISSVFREIHRLENGFFRDWQCEGHRVVGKVFPQVIRNRANEIVRLFERSFFPHSAQHFVLILFEPNIGKALEYLRLALAKSLTKIFGVYRVRLHEHIESFHGFGIETGVRIAPKDFELATEHSLNRSRKVPFPDFFLFHSFASHVFDMHM